MILVIRTIQKEYIISINSKGEISFSPDFRSFEQRKAVDVIRELKERNLFIETNKL